MKESEEEVYKDAIAVQSTGGEKRLIQDTLLCFACHIDRICGNYVTEEGEDRIIVQSLHE